MKILLVEDEIHKRDEIVGCVREAFDLDPDIVDGVNSAVLSVLKEDYDLIILDMALSTFGEHADDLKKGHDQAQGGIEVLRALKRKGQSSKIVIVTQYPDFYIGNAKIKLKQASRVIGDKYSQNVIGAILYHYKSKQTLQKITSILRGAR
ncbi:response regulator [Burkholderia gladioli]|uniref:response regulator n=1 Tax=Burkholderia gladioli TaxID=28095 RepID=UPI001364A6A4|nr:response regulator [Burkholderia gladioli]WAG17958.1 response regulator [Burkholderia gladioli]WAG18036.1 response regulator [Burkholderia gladioli]